jgi:hypothetical protein
MGLQGVEVVDVGRPIRRDDPRLGQSWFSPAIWASPEANLVSVRPVCSVGMPVAGEIGE